MTGADIPMCSVCCETLGKYGGPATLPCGHNGCVNCFRQIQAKHAQCPLCRSPFSATLPLACNTELRDLIDLASSIVLDDRTKEEGWEAFPSTLDTANHYASDVIACNRSAQHGGGGGPPPRHGPAALFFGRGGGGSGRRDLGSGGDGSQGLTHGSSSLYPHVPGSSGIYGAYDLSGGDHAPSAPPAPGHARNGYDDYTHGVDEDDDEDGGSLFSRRTASAAAAAITGGRDRDRGSSSAGGPSGGQQGGYYGYGGGTGALVPHGQAGRLAPELQCFSSRTVGSDGLMDPGVWSLEPPVWLPDSFATQCSGCHSAFRPLLRLRHHCRLCGKIFCHSCSSNTMLLPPKYMQREPQRVCVLCSCLLAPLQRALASTMAAAAQAPVHDAHDAIALRSWLNAPYGATMVDELFKAANMLRTFTTVGRAHPERGLPTAVLQGARGLVALAMLKVGAGWSAAFGTGVMVTRDPRQPGTWSAPCAVACYGLGWGLQIGAELVDMLLVLRTEESVAALCSGNMHLGVGGHAGIAIGPLGRDADAAVMVSEHGARAPVMAYSCSRGAFVGASLQACLFTARTAVNHSFYGFPVSPKQLLLDRTAPPPPAAGLLYDTLHALMAKYENRGHLVHAQQLSHERALAHE